MVLDEVSLIWSTHHIQGRGSILTSRGLTDHVQPVHTRVVDHLCVSTLKDLKTLDRAVEGGGIEIDDFVVVKEADDDDGGGEDDVLDGHLMIGEPERTSRPRQMRRGGAQKPMMRNSWLRFEANLEVEIVEEMKGVGQGSAETAACLADDRRVSFPRSSRSRQLHQNRVLSRRPDISRFGKSAFLLSTSIRRVDHKVVSKLRFLVSGF